MESIFAISAAWFNEQNQPTHFHVHEVINAQVMEGMMVPIKDVHELIEDEDNLLLSLDIKYLNGMQLNEDGSLSEVKNDKRPVFVETPSIEFLATCDFMDAESMGIEKDEVSLN